MAVVKIIAKSTTGVTHTFKELITIVYQTDRFTPADILEFSALDDVSNNIFTRVYMYIDNTLVFTGIVDVQKKHIGTSGRYISFVCRHIHSGMLDNEVRPYVYTKLSSDQLIKNHALPHGINGHKFPYQATANEIVAYKGVSDWEFIKLFCNLVYRAAPYVDGDGYITLSGTNTRMHYFSNVVDGYINFTDAIVTYDTYSLFSRVFMKTGNDDIGAKYNYVMSNALAKRYEIERTRYHNSSSEWQNNLEQNAIYLIENSTMDYLEIELHLPDIYDISAGDSANFSDPSGNFTFMYVSSYKFTLDETGQKSVVKLWSKEII